MATAAAAAADAAAAAGGFLLRLALVLILSSGLPAFFWLRILALRHMCTGES